MMGKCTFQLLNLKVDTIFTYIVYQKKKKTVIGKALCQNVDTGDLGVRRLFFGGGGALKVFSNEQILLFV